MIRIRDIKGEQRVILEGEPPGGYTAVALDALVGKLDAIAADTEDEMGWRQHLPALVEAAQENASLNTAMVAAAKPGTTLRAEMVKAGLETTG